MRTWLRYQKWCVRLSYGGLALGILQGLQMVDWASFWTSLLSVWLSALISLLLGGNATNLLNQLTT